MKRLELWKLSVLNVFSAPVRSLLTVLGFAIGVAAILAVLTLGTAGREQVQSEMGRLGIDRIWMTESGGGGLPQNAADWLADTMDMQTEAFICFPARVTSMFAADIAAVIGCEAAYLADVELEQGRLFWPVEFQQCTQSALIGSELAEKLGVRTGGWIAVGTKVFRVCGIVGQKDGISTAAPKEALILPLRTASEWTGGMVNEIQLSTGREQSMQTAQKRAVLLLQSQGYSVRTSTMEVQMEAASSVIFTFVNVLKWVALVCILVGGIGVMNILLVSIRERRREIGVMKSLGTTPGQICLLFLLEALVYAVIGGAAGLLIGVVLIDAAGRSIQLTAYAKPSDCIAVFLCALAVGMLSGALPALRASFLKCVDALREE